MEKSYQLKILLFPVLVSFITTLSVIFIEGQGQGGSEEHRTLILALIIMVFLAIYFFTIVVVVPINMYLFHIIQNKWISYILFNVIGFALIICIDIWFLTVVECKPLYIIFPLFSFLSLVFRTEN